MFATDPTVWESGECLVLVTGGETEVNDKRGGKRIRTFVVLKKIVVPWILLDCVVIVKVSKFLVGCSCSSAQFSKKCYISPSFF